MTSFNASKKKNKPTSSSNKASSLITTSPPHQYTIIMTSLTSTTETETRYPKSYPLICNLARTTTNGLSEPSPFNYVDSSLETIAKNITPKAELERKFDTLELRFYRKLDNIEERSDQRTVQMESRMDARFAQVDKHLAQIDERFERLESRFDHLCGKFDNSECIRLNSKRYRLFHKINVIRAYRLNPQSGRCEWMTTPDFPKHLKAFRDMGNHARDQWTEQEIARLSTQQRANMQQNCLKKIERLVEFYDARVYADDKSETDATEVILDSMNVDDHLESLGDKWGLEWYDIAQIPDEEPNKLAGKKRGSSFWEPGPSVRMKTN